MGYKVLQIEVSNHCSLTCRYCPHPAQLRPKGHMTRETFAKCMALVAGSDNPECDGRKFVWLNHFGEPLLNALLPEFISSATALQVEVSFASCGVDTSATLFPRSLWQELADAGLRGVMLSAHKKSAQVLRDHVGDIVNVIDVWTPHRANLHDWAGQVDMSSFRLKPMHKPESPCDYRRDNMFAVTWDGKLAACCYDVEGRVALSVDDVLKHGFQFREISLCASCRLGRGDADWLFRPY